MKGKVWFAAVGIALASIPLASHANADTPPTINLTDIPDIASLPVCVEEDCSDQPGQVGVWQSPRTGDWYLERGESQTWLIIDNTVTDLASGPNAWEAGSYVGGYN